MESRGDQRKFRRIWAICRSRAVGSLFVWWWQKYLKYFSGTSPRIVFRNVTTAVTLYLRRWTGYCFLLWFYSVQGCSKKITDMISSNATFFISLLSGFLILGLFSIVFNKIILKILHFRNTSLPIFLDSCLLRKKKKNKQLIKIYQNSYL